MVSRVCPSSGGEWLTRKSKANQLENDKAIKLLDHIAWVCYMRDNRLMDIEAAKKDWDAATEKLVEGMYDYGGEGGCKERLSKAPLVWSS